EYRILFIKRYKSAEEFVHKSIEIDKKYYSEKNSGLANDYINMAMILSEKKEFKMALYYYQRAIIANLPDFNDTIVYHNPIKLNGMSRKYLCDALFGKAKASFHVFKESNSAPKQIDFSISTYDLLYQLINEMCNDYNHENTRLVLSEMTKDYFEGALMASMSYDSIKSNDKIPEKTLEYFEKSKSATLNAFLNDLRVKSYLGIADSLIEREKEIAINRRYYETKIQQAKAEKDGYDTLLVQEYQDELFNYSRRYDSLLVVLKDNYPEYYQLKYQQNVATLEQISQQLDNKSALINYFVADTSLFILAVSKNSQVCKGYRLTALLIKK
ncbi:MAG: tetratricopeptide repeat protein, partial [Chloroflexia bacterium]|nr:tetratricopeptide repeat protein [Chloroflexia bacterium]